MLAYAASRRVPAKRHSSPQAMLLVICTHIAVIAAVMSAKMDLPQRLRRDPPLVIFKIPPPPPQPRLQATPPRPTQNVGSTEALPDPVFRPRPLTEPSDTMVDSGSAGTVAGNPNVELPNVPNFPPAIPVRHGPFLRTPAFELKPPYPASKLASEEEATLTLRLSIDDRGHVVAVEPVGHADSVFLDAARRHILAHWQYDPATQDGKPTPASIVITLRFELDS